MAKKKPKYQRMFHEGLVIDEVKELEALYKKVDAVKKKALKKLKFGLDSRVAVMDSHTQKFKWFAYLTQIITAGTGRSPYILRYQRETTGGKKHKQIETLNGLEFLLDPQEADTSLENTWQMPDIKHLKI